METGGQEIWKPLVRVGVSGRAEDETKMHMGGGGGDGLRSGEMTAKLRVVSLRAIVACPGGSKNGIMES